MAKKAGYYNGKYHYDIKKYMKTLDKAIKAEKELKDYVRKLEMKYGHNSKYKDWPKTQQKKFDRLLKKSRELALDLLKY